MRAVALLAALAACTPTQRVRALTATTTALLVVDAMQTRSNVGECAEMNPMIGRCGENIPVGQYFGVMIAMNLMLAVGLPESWKVPVLGSITTIEAVSTANNVGEGKLLRVKEPWW